MPLPVGIPEARDFSRSPSPPSTHRWQPEPRRDFPLWFQRSPWSYVMPGMHASTGFGLDQGVNLPNDQHDRRRAIGHSPSGGERPKSRPKSRTPSYGQCPKGQTPSHGQHSKGRGTDQGEARDRACPARCARASPMRATPFPCSRPRDRLCPDQPGRSRMRRRQFIAGLGMAVSISASL